LQGESRQRSGSTPTEEKQIGHLPLLGCGPAWRPGGKAEDGGK